MKNTRGIINLINIVADNILPLLFWALVIFGLDTPMIAILTVLSALIHELGHIFAFLMCDGRISLKAHLSGFRIKKEHFSYSKEILAIAAGPLSNIAVFVLCTALTKSVDSYLSAFGYVNLLTAISNLLPISGYDGYGILNKTFEALNINGALRALPYISMILMVLLTFLSLYFLLLYDTGYWIFGVFFILLVTKISEFLKQIKS